MKKISGYSGTPLSDKLGIKSGFVIRLINHPDYYFDLFSHLPGDLKISVDKKIKKDLIHYFSSTSAQLKKDIPFLRKEIVENGIIWISWPKKASKIQTDVDENLVRQVALENGLVDVKVCAVDDTWSALKLVIPLKDRK